MKLLFLNKFKKHIVSFLCRVFLFSLFLVPKTVKAIPVEDSGSYVNQMLDYTLKYQYFYTTDAPSQWGQWAEGIVTAYNAVQNTIHNKLIELKEYVFDGLAWTAANVIIDQFGDALVDWIRNGFEGSPMFLSDPEGFFRDTANQLSGAIIDDLDMEWLCDPLGKLRLNIDFFFPAPIGQNTPAPLMTSQTPLSPMRTGTT